MFRSRGSIAGHPVCQCTDIANNRNETPSIQQLRSISELLTARGESPASHRGQRTGVPNAAAALGWWCARLARRDDREYREYLREEQRSQAGCSAGRMQPDFHHGLLGLDGVLEQYPSSPTPDHQLACPIRCASLLVVPQLHALNGLPLCIDACYGDPQTLTVADHRDMLGKYHFRIPRI